MFLATSYENFHYIMQCFFREAADLSAFLTNKTQTNTKLTIGAHCF